MTRQQWLTRFGRAVREARTARGWSVAELAGRVTLNPLTVEGIEAGRREVVGSQVAQLVSALGIATPPWEVVPGSEAEQLTRVTGAVRRLQGEVRSARTVLAGARRSR